MKHARLTDRIDTSRSDRGSALLMAMFVMVLLSGLGISLLFLSRTETRMSQADVRTKTAFFLAESALETARGLLYDVNVNDDFTDDITAAAGGNGVIDFDRTAITVQYDSKGEVSGFAGFGDDVALAPLTVTEDGWYIAFLTNDPLDIDPLADANNRVVLTGIGAGRDKSLEIVQAVIEKIDILPTPPPAAITLLGPSPSFDSGNSSAKDYLGTDCGTGATGLHFPVVGTVGSGAEADAEAGVKKPGTFSSGINGGLDTVADLTDATEPTVVTSGMGTIDPMWLNCQFLLAMAEEMEIAADYVCRGGTCSIPTLTPNDVFFIDGDIAFDQTVHGTGTLFVTGELTMSGRASWNGLMFVVGEGRFERSGGGNGAISGAMLIADIAGPDDVYGTADDCTGGDAGFDSIQYNTSGNGTGDSVYCTADINNANPVSPYRVVSYIQR